MAKPGNKRGPERRGPQVEYETRTITIHHPFIGRFLDALIKLDQKLFRADRQFRDGKMGYTTHAAIMAAVQALYQTFRAATGDIMKGEGTQPRARKRPSSNRPAAPKAKAAKKPRASTAKKKTTDTNGAAKPEPTKANEEAKPKAAKRTPAPVSVAPDEVTLS